MFARLVFPSALVLLVAGPALAVVPGPVVTHDPGGRIIKRTTGSGVIASPPVDDDDPGVPGCVPAGPSGAVLRGYPEPGWSIDPCGVRAPASPGPTTVDSFTTRRIARMTTHLSYENHQAGGAIGLFGFANIYTLSDGTTWQSGAGSTWVQAAQLDHVEVDGTVVRYYLTSPTNGVVYQQTDYDAGDHSSQGTLAATAPLVIEATIGDTAAIMRGDALIVSNDPTWYGEPRFNYFASIPGATVPFHLSFDLIGTSFTPDLFDREFGYSTHGDVDFAHPTTTPALTGLSIQGTAQVPSGRTASYAAVVTFEGGATRRVEDEASWTVSPSALATVSAGVLTVGALPNDYQPLVLTATYTSNGVTATGTKTVLGRLAADVPNPDAWPTFQGGPRHTGYVPLQLDPADFTLRWTKNVSPGYALNPVTAADGRVFVSIQVYFNSVPQLFVLDARDGDTLWTKTFGDVFSVNPPAFAYGNVYVQTGDHADDTYLRSFDAATGEVVFVAPHAAQWERYYAPTVVDGTAYVNGGYYGGMYAFDAFSGAQRWFQGGLPQYDEWTPGVFENRAIAYTGGQVQVLDRASGNITFTITDPGYQWNGWSMDLAPVILDDGDVLAIHNGRLLRFDVTTRAIQFELTSQYTGQPSVANGSLYAIDSGRLKVLDAATGALRWSWQPSNGASLRDTMIVTDSHVLVGSASATYAVDLSTHDAAWSYPASGHLALANDTLYIASQNGSLTAIATPGLTQVPPVSISIEGPPVVPESSSRPFKAFVVYSDGRVRERTFSAQWLVQPTTYASIDEDGLLTTTEMFEIAQDAVIAVAYQENGAVVSAAKPIRLVIGVSVPEFFERHRAKASELHAQAEALINEALERERAALRAIDASAESPLPPSEDARPLCEEAMDADRMALISLREALEALVDAEATPPSLTPPTGTPAGPPKKRRVRGEPAPRQVEISP